MPRYLLDGQETARFSFRRISPGDFEAWLPFYLEPKSTSYWEGIPADPTTACEEHFERIFERYEANMGGMNALECKKTRNLIGMCGLLVQTVDEIEELEIGYSILPEYWRLGYATEAAVHTKKYAFDAELSPSLISIIHVDNHPSKKVARNNGMEVEKQTIYKENPVEIFRVFR